VIARSAGPAPLAARVRGWLALGHAAALLTPAIPALAHFLWPPPEIRPPTNALAALDTVLDLGAAAGRGQALASCMLAAFALAALASLRAWRLARRDGSARGRRGLLFSPLLLALLLLAAASVLAQPRPAAPTTLHRAAMDDRHEAISLAIRRGDAAQALALSAAGLDPRRADANGNTLLHEAVIFVGDRALVDALLRAGSSVAARNGNGETPLQAALAWAHYRHQADGPQRLQAVAEQLLAGGAAVEVADADGRPLLARALDLKHAPLLQRLLATGAALPDDALLQALRAAEGEGDLATLEVVLRHARPRHLAARDDAGTTPAHLAAHRPLLLPALRRLAERGADLRARSRRGDTPFAQAAAGDNLPAMRWLADRGAMRLESADDEGQAPLHLAAYGGRAEVLQWLLQQGASPAARDVAGRRPLDIVIDTERFAHRAAADKLTLVRLLGGGEADIARGRHFGHPLHQAVAARDLSAVERLLKQGADPDLRDESGHAPLWTALAYSSALPATAAEHEFGRRLLRLLLRHGADPTRVLDARERTTYIDHARSLRIADLLETEMRRHSPRR